MSKYLDNNPPDWATLLQRIKLELAGLGNREKEWLKERLAVIGEVQVALDELFRKAGGLEACSLCDGTCCGCGRHHLTLTNLLAYLLQGETPPAPDFNQTCPYLGVRGCLLTVGRRPYNCITFFCETLEDRLEQEECAQLRNLDQKLRREYQQIANRYPAASLRGLWIALQRIGDGALLYSPGSDVLK